MNAEQLKQLVLAADRQALVEALAPLDEKQRQDLCPDAMGIYRIVEKSSFAQPDDDQPIGLEDQPWFDADFLADLRRTSYPDWRCPRWTASLMMLAVADDDCLHEPWTHELSWLRRDLEDLPQRVAEVLRDRRPRWLRTFVRKDVKSERPIISWRVEAALIREGALPPDDSGDHYKRMAIDAWEWHYDYSDARRHDATADRPATWADVLRQHPEVLENSHLKLFTHDTRAFSQSDSPWFDAIKTLSDEGDVDRQAVLRASAAAMSRPFGPKTVGGFGKMHQHLSPSVAERQGCVDDYLAALHSPHSAVVGTALKALGVLIKQRQLDAGAFLSNCHDALRLAQKGPPIQTFKLIDQLIGQHPAATGEAAECWAIAVTHGRPDVQEAAIERLEATRASQTNTTRQYLLDSQPLVAAVLQSRLAALLGDPEATDVVDEVDPPTARSDELSLIGLQERLSSVPPGIGRATQADRAVAEVEDKQLAQPFVAELVAGEVPRRDPASAVEPIGSLEELIDTVAMVIEGVDDVMDIERILDGVARFGGERPEDFDSRVGPLRKRFETLNKRHSGSVVDLGAEFGFSQLLADWLDLPVIRHEPNRRHDFHGPLFRGRCREIQKNWSGRPPSHRLLALPTHRDGWIDPEVLVERIKVDHVEKKKSVLDNDLIQALLRLTPDGRASAAAAFSSITEGHSAERYYTGGNPVAFALGQDVSMDLTPHWSYGTQLQAAAVHARQLTGEVEDRWLDIVAEAETDSQARVRISGPFFDDPSLPARLCVLAHSTRNDGQPVRRPIKWWDGLEAMTWPANPQPMFMMGHLDRVFDEDLTWTREATRVVVLATSEDNKDVRLQSGDALIEAIDQVRVSADRLGHQLADLVETIKLKRTAEAFASAAQVSLLHQWVIFHAIDQMIGRLLAIPKDLHHLLTPMLEASVQCGVQPSGPASLNLKSIRGSTKAARLAKQILDVPNDSKRQLACRLRSADAAVRRAERWSQRIAAKIGSRSDSQQ